jgi:hypothetical protein
MATPPLYACISQAKVVAVKTPRIATLLLVAAFAWPLTAHAAPKTYLAGKLLSIQSPEVDSPLPLPSGQTLLLPMHFSYQFEIQLGDVVYVGYCQTREYKAEWHVGDEMQFRTKKDKMYLKRPNGKEFGLEFLLQAKLGPDGKPVTILSQRTR